jgi:HAE1 family hydrophobic/amphiphilic exporter-1
VFRLAVLSLRHRAVVALVTLAILAAGVFSLTDLKQELIPSLQLPTAAVVATYAGTSPAVVYDQVTGPVEAAARSVPGVTGLTSTASAGLSLTLVRFDDGTNLDEANLKLQAALTRAAGVLPAGVQTQVLTGSLDDYPVIQVAVTGRDGLVIDPATVAQTAGQVLVPTLEQLPGVRAVDVTGFTPDVITLNLQTDAMAQYGVTASQILSVLRDYGLTVPVGTVADGNAAVPVQLGQPIESLDQLKAIPLRVIQPQPPAQATATASPGASAAPTAAAEPEPATTVTLGMVVQAVYAPEPATSYSRVCDLPLAADTACPAAVTLAVTKTPAGNTVDVAHAVADAVAAANDVLADYDLQARVTFDQAPFITDSITALGWEGLMGLGACLVVILVFLLSFRSMLVTAVSIPLSLLAALIVLRLTGETLNVLTIGALTIAIGRVVDDAIVVTENIKRHLSYGQDKRPAVLAAVKEVAGAVTASTVVTVAVFAPLAFVHGAVGQLFRPFAWTLACAMAASLLVALTIVPVLAYWFVRRPVTVDQADAERLRAQAEAKERQAPLQRAYLATLRGALAHPVLVVLAAVLVLGATAWFGRGLGTAFLSGQGQDTLTVTVAYPPNTSLDVENQEAVAIEQALAGVAGLQTIQTSVGGADAAQPTSSFALTLADDAGADVADRIRAALAGVVVVGTAHVPDVGASLLGSSTVDLLVQSDDPDRLAEAAAQVEAMALTLSQAGEVTNNLATGQQVFEVRVDRVKAAAAGLTETAIAQTVAALAAPTAIGTITQGSAEVTVKVALGTAPATTSDLLAVPLGIGPDGPVTLGAVADIVSTSAPSVITATDGRRSATVSVTPAGQDLGALTRQIQAGLADLDATLPAGVTVTVGGLAQLQADAFSDLGLALLIAIALVYIVMVATFGSLLQPLLLLVAIPFAATGALAALLAFREPLGVAPLVGLLLLVGLVTSNAIVLIDLINQYRATPGRTLDQAITDGARRRLRPILMTAAATVLALTPMALGLAGHQSMVSRPLALTVLGGLVSSTLLTLVVVPVLYRWEARLHDRRAARRAAKQEQRRRARAAALGVAVPAETTALAEVTGAPADSGPAEPVASPPAPVPVPEPELASAPQPTPPPVAGPPRFPVPAPSAQSALSGPSAQSAPSALSALSALSAPSALSAGTPAEVGETGRFRAPLFRPEELEEGPSTGERLLAELQRVRATEEANEATGERLRPPLFSVEDMTLPGVVIPGLAALQDVTSTNPGAGERRVALKPTASVELATPEDASVARGVAEPTVRVGSFGGPVPAQPPAPALPQQPLFPATSSAASAVAPAPGVAPRPAPPVAPPVAWPPAAPVTPAVPVTPVLPAVPVTPVADPTLRPGPSGWPAAAPVRTLWPDQGLPAGSMWTGDPAAPAPAPAPAEPKPSSGNPFEHVSPRGLTNADRDDLAVSAAAPVPRAVPWTPPPA